MKRTEPRSRDRALAWLARREYSGLELRERLARTGCPEPEIASLLEELRNEGAQSDERFTEEFVRIRRIRGEGPIRIARALEARGIGRELAARHLARTEGEWVRAAEEARAARFGGALPEDAGRQGIQARFLLRRGFSAATVAGLWQSWGRAFLEEASSGTPDGEE